jgi:membrane-bound lytic murein transglycosylase D
MSPCMRMLRLQLPGARLRRWLAILLILILTGCSSSALVRNEPEIPVADSGTSARDGAGDPAVSTEVARQKPAPASPSPAEPERRLIPRDSLRKHFSSTLEFPDCTRLDARSRRWLDKLDRQQASVADSLRSARPLMDLVAAELERRDLPMAFALLPMIESRYFPHPGKSGGPAGIWQLMPATARGLSVPVSAGYDGRLDFLRASRAASDLLVHLAGQFDRNWRLVDMAFNAGEFRIKKALRRSRQTPAQLDPDALGLSKITLHHLAQLEAWACLLAETPELLQEEAADPLMALAISEPIRLDFLAFLAGIDTATLRRWNPALRSLFTPADASLQILLPAVAAEAAERALGQLEGTSLAHWQRVPAHAEVQSIRLQHGAHAEAIIAINRIEESQTAGKPTLLWLPTATAAHRPRQDRGHEIGATVHTVRAGDSLWTLARRYRVALKGLMEWNGLNAGSVLQPGQVLRLRPP